MNERGSYPSTSARTSVESKGNASRYHSNMKVAVGRFDVINGRTALDFAAESLIESENNEAKSRRPSYERGRVPARRLEVLPCWSAGLSGARLSGRDSIHTDERAQLHAVKI